MRNIPHGCDPSTFNGGKTMWEVEIDVMSTQSQSVIARTNNLINNHRVASSLIAGSLLASTALISAAAIGYSGQMAVDTYDYPVASSPMDRNDKQTEQTPIETAPASDSQTGEVQGVSTSVVATSASAKPILLVPAQVRAINVVNAPVTTVPVTPVQPVNPINPVNPQPVDETPIEEEPVDEPEAAPGFTVRVENFEHLTFREAPYLDQIMQISTAGIYVDYEAGYDLTGKQLTFTATPLSEEHYCEISNDKAGTQLLTSIPEASSDGSYVCRVTVSDGTISRSIDYATAHVALVDIENPQPANGYDFMFNMPLLGTIEGLNVYTSKFNYAASPFCDDNGFYVCTSTASIAFDVRAAAGLTIPQINETIFSEDTPGLSCNVFASPSFADNGYGIITLHASSDLEDGFYACEFSLIEGNPTSSGWLVAELVNGQFRSITSEQLNDDIR